MKVGTKLWMTLAVVVGLLLFALIVASGRSTASNDNQDERKRGKSPELFGEINEIFRL